MNTALTAQEREDGLLHKDNKQSQKALKKEQKRKNQRCKRISLVLVSLALVGLLVFLNIYFKDFYYDLYLLTKDIIGKGSIQTFVSILIVNMFLQMCFVPGISFFIIFVGFITKNYLYSVALIYPSTILICSLTFFLTKYSIKDWLHKSLSKKWYFKVYYDQSLKSPWKTSFFLRILLIPVTYKNYLIALMDINFLQFIVPACFYYLPYFSSYILIGILISNVQDILNGKIPDQDKKFYIALISFYSAMVLVSLVVVIYLIILTARTYKEYKRARNELETRNQFDSVF